MDSGQALDAGLTSVNWSMLTASNPALPKISGAEWSDIGVVNNDSAQTVAGNKTFSGANTHSGANTFTSTVNLSGAVLQGGTPLVFEGSIDNAFETSVVVTNPTADRTVTIPEASVDLALVRYWSDTLAGVVQAATGAEVRAGLDATKAVTPAGLASGTSVAGNGYITLPGGYILQIAESAVQGDVGAGGLSVTVTFPTPFLSNCYHVFPAILTLDSGGARQISAVNTAKTLTGATFVVFEGSAVVQSSWYLKYLAVGN
ncbi:MAG: hypothetical protein ABIR91_04890 [Candidatus Saccharimonadales bacterium]